MNTAKRIIVISSTVLVLMLQSGFVKEGRDVCLDCVKCYDRAWDDGYRLGKGTGTVNERYRIIRNMLNAHMSDEQIIQYTHTSYVELEDVKNQLIIYKGRFEFEMPN